MAPSLFGGMSRGSERRYTKCTRSNEIAGEQLSKLRLRGVELTLLHEDILNCSSIRRLAIYTCDGKSCSLNLFAELTRVCQTIRTEPSPNRYFYLCPHTRFNVEASLPPTGCCGGGSPPPCAPWPATDLCAACRRHRLPSSLYPPKIPPRRRRTTSKSASSRRWSSTDQVSKTVYHAVYISTLQLTRLQSIAIYCC